MHNSRSVSQRQKHSAFSVPTRRKGRANTESKSQLMLRGVRALFVLMVLLFAVMMSWRHLTPERPLIPQATAPGHVAALHEKQFVQYNTSLQCPSSAYYTAKEVAGHTTEADLWLVINNNVLDVSSYVSKHPGGLLIMEGAGGHDVGELFSQFHKQETVTLLKKYCIGRLKG
ncbi:hypothetical protein TRVL_06809 [Trypanosoma vivax]|nr:hypothetical protein TRVL_06809 [Trypanosoma vivax]